MDWNGWKAWAWFFNIRIQCEADCIVKCIIKICVWKGDVATPVFEPIMDRCHYENSIFPVVEDVTRLPKVIRFALVLRHFLVDRDKQTFRKGNDLFKSKRTFHFNVFDVHFPVKVSEQSFIMFVAIRSTPFFVVLWSELMNFFFLQNKMSVVFVTWHKRCRTNTRTLQLALSIALPPSSSNALFLEGTHIRDPSRFAQPFPNFVAIGHRAMCTSSIIR